jgi:hypothetical protein
VSYPASGWCCTAIRGIQPVSGLPITRATKTYCPHLPGFAAESQLSQVGLDARLGALRVGSRLPLALREFAIGEHGISRIAAGLNLWTDYLLFISYFPYLLFCAPSRACWMRCEIVCSCSHGDNGCQIVTRCRRQLRRFQASAIPWRLPLIVRGCVFQMVTVSLVEPGSNGDDGHRLTARAPLSSRAFLGSFCRSCLEFELLGILPTHSVTAILSPSFFLEFERAANQSFKDCPTPHGVSLPQVRSDSCCELKYLDPSRKRARRESPDALEA